MTWTGALSEKTEKWKKALRKAWQDLSDRGVAITKRRDQGSQSEDLYDRPHRQPVVDVLENDRELLIIADVPGAERSSMEVVWDGRQGLYFWAEGQPSLSFGEHWYRAFALPNGFDAAKAYASVKEGVLSITVPRVVSTPSKQIPVRT